MALPRSEKPRNKPAYYKDEKVVKTYKPNSFAKHVLYPFDKRTAFIVTTKRVVFRGPFRFMDKAVAYPDIGEVTITDWGLQITQKGADLTDLPSGFLVRGWVPAKEAKQIIDEQRMKLDKKELI